MLSGPKDGMFLDKRAVPMSTIGLVHTKRGGTYVVTECHKPLIGAPSFLVVK